MTARFAAFGDHGNGSRPLDQARERDRSDHGNHLDPGLIPGLHVLARVARTGNHDGHPLLDHDPRDLIGMRAHEHHVDAERLVRFLTQLANLVAQPCCIGVHSRDDAEAPRFRYGRGERGVGDPCHTALKNRGLDPEHRAEIGLEHRYFSS